MTVHLLLAAAMAQDPSSFPTLRDALQDPGPEVRAAAAFAVGQLGMIEVPEGDTEPASLPPTRAAASQALTAVASDPEPAVRRAAVEALGKVGGLDVESVLLSAASDADAGVRGEAALALFRRRLLKRVPEYSTAAVTALSALAGDPEADVRWRAVYAFTRFPDPRAMIADAQKDADPRVRLFAVRALNKMKRPVDPAVFADPDAYVRAEAVAASTSPPLAAFIDPSAHVRAAAADAAASSGDEARYVPLLETLAAEPGTLAPGRALLALAKLGAGAETLAKARRDPRWWIRARGFEAAGARPGGELLAGAGILDSDPRVAAQALETLAVSTGDFAASMIADVLLDPKAALELRGTAIDAATERKDPLLVGGLLASMKNAVEPELRGDIRKALEATAKAHPETAAKVAAALKKFPPFQDKPRRFRALKTAPSVLVKTVKGDFVIALSSEAENHAAAFVESVKKGFYDGLTWHRVVTAFVIQGGDPRGSGWGDAGWRLADEVNPAHFLRGTVGMPKAGKDTGGCQLFVSLVPTPHLDGRYTVFGQVVSGLDVLDRIEPSDKIVSMRLLP